MKAACFGDSLTFGQIGYSYRKYLDSGLQIKNRGINGDTTIPVYHRLKRYIENPKNKDTELYILHVGTNDLLLLYLTKLSLAWKIQIGMKEKRKRCIEDDVLFEQAYEKYFQLFEQHHAACIIV